MKTQQAIYRRTWALKKREARLKEKLNAVQLELARIKKERIAAKEAKLAERKAGVKRRPFVAPPGATPEIEALRQEGAAKGFVQRANPNVWRNEGGTFAFGTGLTNRGQVVRIGP